MLAFSIPGKWCVPDSAWFPISQPYVPFSFGRSANRAQWHRNVSLEFNGLSIVTGEAQEDSDILTVLRLRPIHYRTSRILLGVDAVLVNVKVTKIDFLISPGAFCMFGR